MVADVKSTDTEPNVVNLTILLEGGHRETITVDADHPALATAIEMMLRPGDRDTLIQLPLAAGTAMLAINSRRVIGLISQPPLQIEPDDKPLEIEGALTGSVESALVHVIDDFLPASMQQKLIDYSLENHNHFVPTTTSTGATQYRDSLVLHEFPELATDLRKHLARVLPQIQEKFQCGELSDIVEMQLTAHNDGNYYKIHNDNGSACTANRELTYVYYFHRQPKAFDGGELKIYDSLVRQGQYVAAPSYRLIEPVNNRLVFFLARYPHEVLPISCPTRRFQDSRFTVNGWIHLKTTKPSQNRIKM